jgi:hypothetical protein
VEAMAKGLLVAAALSAIAALVVMRVLAGRSVKHGSHARIGPGAPATKAGDLT